MAEGLRLRLFHQSVAVWARDWNPAHWIKTGELKDAEHRQRVEEDPAVLVAQEQIRRDGGRAIPENIARAVQGWRERKGLTDG